MPRARALGLARNVAKSVIKCVGRLLLYGLAGALVVVVVAVVVLLAILNTDWARERARARLEAALEERVEGDVEIGQLEGWLLGNVTLHQVAVSHPGPDGRPAILIDEVGLRFDVWSLAQRELYVHELAIRGATVLARRDAEGAVDLAGLWKSEASEHEDTGQSWRVLIELLQVEESAVVVSVMHPGGKPDTYHLEEINVVAGLAARQGRTTVDLDQGFFRLRERALPITMSGRLAVTPESIQVRDAWVQASASELSLATLSLERPTGAVAGSLSMSVSAADIARYAGDDRWRAPVLLRGTVVRPGASSPWQLGLAGTVGHAGAWSESASQISIDALVQRDVPAPGQISWLAALPGDAPGQESRYLAARVHVRADDIDPAELREGAPAGRIDASLTVDLALGNPGRPLDTITATAEGQISGQVSGTQVDATVRATLDRGELEVTVDGRTPHGAGQVRARADLGADQLVVEGSVDARDIAWADVRAGALTAALVVTGLELPQDSAKRAGSRARGFAAGRVPSGRITLTARDVAHGDTPIGQVQVAATVRPEEGTGPEAGIDIRGDIDIGERTALNQGQAHVRVRWRRRAAYVTFERMQVRTRALEWTGHGSLVLGLANRAPTGRVLLRELVLASEAGELRASGHLRRWGQRGTLTLAVRDLELGVVRAGLPPEMLEAGGTPMLLGGRMDLRAQLEPHRLDVSATVERARIGDLAPVFAMEASVQGTKDRLHAELAVDADGMALGSASVTVAADASLLWHDPRRLVAAPVHGEVELPGIALARLAALAGVHEPVRGHLHGTAWLSGTMDDPRVTAAMGVVDPGSHGVMLSRLDITGSVDRRGWTLTADGWQQAGGRLSLALERQGKRPAWTLTGATGTLEASRFELAALDPLLDLVDAPVRSLGGRLSADIETSAVPAGAEPPRLRGWLRVRQGRMRMLQGPTELSELDAYVRASSGWLTVRATASAGKAGYLGLKGQSALDGWRPVDWRGKLSGRRVPVLVANTRAAVDLDAGLRIRWQPKLVRIYATVQEGTVRLPELDARELHETSTLEDVVYEDAQGRLRASEQPAARGQRQRPGPAALAAARAGAGAGTGTGTGTNRGTTVRLHVRTPSLVRVRGENDIDTQVHTDIDITFVRGLVVIDGSLEASQGTVTIFNRRYEIASAQVSFDGRVPFDPTLDIRLARRFEDVRVLIDVSGTLDHPRVDLLADAGVYSRSELLGFVLGGSSPVATGHWPADGASRAASAFLASRLESALAGHIPIDTLHIDTAAGESTRLSQVTLGKWISDDLFVAYRRRFDARAYENANEAMFEYHFLQRWVLEGRLGDRGAGSLEVLWVKRY